jgi:hypothetical protein
MDEKAKIVAFAKLCGATGTPIEILEKYDEYFKEALEFLSQQSEQVEAKVFKRPF